MTQGNKELLLKYLCMALPYGVKGIITYNGDKDIFTVKGIFNILFLSDTECCHVEDFKPFLRPMSSMTDEEEYEYEVLTDCSDYTYFKTSYKVIKWLLEHHFDFMDLIPKSLAIKVTEENNPYKE